MIIYKDIVTGDEIISDTYNLIDKDDAVYEVDCKMVTRGGESFDIGANPSAEEADEGTDESSKQVIDVVDGFRLNYLGDEASKTRAFPTKKEYMGQLKTYMKEVVAKLKEGGADEEKIKAFQTGAQNYYTKHIAPNFKDFDFYVGESMDPDGMVMLLNYREDGITPYMTIWKGGLTAMKV
ncbi:MAG: hypothetical protein L6R42_007031 [Xanthoria sp. 1 TBL-2021]|nr:MAG: hypothetical protein L6R42_007031 [Xanthoria sp. 1 TBL-2021]